MTDNDKLPNYYDVTIEATLCEATSEGVRRIPYRLHVEDVLATDGRSAVANTLRSQKDWWQHYTVKPGEGGEGWQFFGDKYDLGVEIDWLEFDLIDDYGDFATAVPYERRLRLVGVRPLELLI